MKDRSFINYNVDIAEHESRIAEFENFTAFQQKEFLIDILDKNQLYVNLSSIEDTDFACTEEEKSLNKDFYKKWKS